MTPGGRHRSLRVGALAERIRQLTTIPIVCGLVTSTRSRAPRRSFAFAISEVSDSRSQRHEPQIIRQIMAVYAAKGGEAFADPGAAQQMVRQEVERYITRFLARFYNLASLSGEDEQRAA